MTEETIDKSLKQPSTSSPPSPSTKDVGIQTEATSYNKQIECAATTLSEHSLDMDSEFYDDDFNFGGYNPYDYDDYSGGGSGVGRHQQQQMSHNRIRRPPRNKRPSWYDIFMRRSNTSGGSNGSGMMMGGGNRNLTAMINQLGYRLSEIERVLNLRQM